MLPWYSLVCVCVGTTGWLRRQCNAACQQLLGEGICAFGNQCLLDLGNWADWQFTLHDCSVTLSSPLALTLSRSDPLTLTLFLFFLPVPVPVSVFAFNLTNGRMIITIVINNKSDYSSTNSTANIAHHLL